jgi:hypothetical protein
MRSILLVLAHRAFPTGVEPNDYGRVRGPDLVGTSRSKLVCRSFILRVQKVLTRDGMWLSRWTETGARTKGEPLRPIVLVIHKGHQLPQFIVGVNASGLHSVVAPRKGTKEVLSSKRVSWKNGTANCHVVAHNTLLKHYALGSRNYFFPALEWEH